MELTMFLFWTGLALWLYSTIKRENLIGCIGFIFWTYCSALWAMNSDSSFWMLFGILSTAINAFAALVFGSLYIYKEKE